MLLFIAGIDSENVLSTSFQYISCYSLSSCHSHVIKRLSVSIHLMLLFIKLYPAQQDRSLSFNTSHVTLYRFLNLFVVPQFFRFNTSHVTLYRCFNLCFFCIVAVSIHLMLLFIAIGSEFALLNLSFNTSHVTLYLHELGLDIYKYKFQYISCYSLSL